MEITARYNESTLFNYTEEGIDIPASLERFQLLAENAISLEFPGATVEVVKSDDAVTTVDGKAGTDETRAVELALDDVWENWAWEVYEDAE